MAMMKFVKKENNTDEKLSKFFLNYFDRIQK
jgi:hypothetical protein